MEEDKEDHVEDESNLEKESKEQSKARLIKEKSKQTWKEIKYLKEQCDVPMNVIAKRLNLSYWNVYKLYRKHLNEENFLIARVKKNLSFKKIHSRARYRINQLLLTSESPL